MGKETDRTKTADRCRELHKLLNSSAMSYSKEKEIKDTFNSPGIIIIFEEEELFAGGKRIVHVGESGRPLWKRLKDHFSTCGSELSIDVRDAIINYLLLKIEKKGELSRDKDSGERSLIPIIKKGISSFMCDHFTFACLLVLDKDKRNRLKKSIIALLYNDADFRASQNWLGQYNFNIDAHIRERGLWLKRISTGEQLSEGVLEDIDELLQASK
jgi:hypothetical protein